MLVSVPVATYNSVDFIIETLESIYNQTYAEIELLISDDFSTDGTIEAVDEWIKQERVINRFVRIEFIKVPANTGISANCNRFIKACQSDWVKMIAGDDILLPNCIEDNVRFINDNPETQIVFSQIRLYQSTFEESSFIKTIPKEFPELFMGKSISAQDQYQLLLLGDRIYYTPSFLLNKNAINKVGGYDESNRLVEDYPMWLKLTSAGIRLDYFHKETVGYRVHPKATNNNGQDVLIKPSQFNNYIIRKAYAHPHLPKRIVLDEKWIHNISLLFKNIGIQKKTKFNQGLYRLMTVYLNPFTYVNSIAKKIK